MAVASIIFKESLNHNRDQLFKQLKAKTKGEEEMTYTKAVKTLRLKDPITQKPVTAKELTDVLKEDVVLAVTRPGSWEGANMLQVLSCHGFFNER